MAGWQRQPALVRAVNAMMRTLGGLSIKLRIPLGLDGGTQRELGIAAMAYQEVELGPVLMRESAAGRVEILISTTALDAVMQGFGAANGLSFLGMAKQIVYRDHVLTVTDVSAERFAGMAYMFRVTAVANNQ